MRGSSPNFAAIARLQDRRFVDLLTVSADVPSANFDVPINLASFMHREIDRHWPAHCLPGYYVEAPVVLWTFDLSITN